MKIGVIAGTPVDTRMGAEYAERFGHRALRRACSASPEEQALAQKLHPERLTEQVTGFCRELAGLGAEGIDIYCNSLTAAVDMPAIRRACPEIPIVTPFDVYAESARLYGRLAIIAANGQSLAAIERIVAENAPDSTVMGASLMPLVTAIEAQRPPDEIVRDCGLEPLLASFRAMGCQALLVGCTHFPYVLDELRRFFPLPVIDPSRRMLELLSGCRGQKT